MRVIVLRSSDIEDERTIAASINRIVAASAERPVVFVDGMGKTGQTLIEAGLKSADQDLVLASALAEGLRTFTTQLAQQITSPSVYRETRSLLSALFEELSDVLKGLYLIGEFTGQARRMISSYGERASCILVAHVLRSRELTAIPFGERESFLDPGDLGSEIAILLQKNSIPVVPLSLRPALGFPES